MILACSQFTRCIPLVLRLVLIGQNMSFLVEYNSIDLVFASNLVADTVYKSLSVCKTIWQKVQKVRNYCLPMSKVNWKVNITHES